MKPFLLFSLVIIIGCDTGQPTLKGTGSQYEKEIRVWCEKNLNDPTGFEVLEVGKPQTNKDGSFWISAKIRAKNQYGGKQVVEKEFRFVKGKVVEWE